MKKLLAAVFIFTAITFLALPMGDVAQAQPRENKVKLIKGFSQDDAALAKMEEKKKDCRIRYLAKWSWNRHRANP